MPLRSNRTPTALEPVSPPTTETTGTYHQLLELLQRGGIRRITLRSYSEYRSSILSDRGSQFVVYTGAGVNTFDKGEVVVKCARLRVGEEKLSQDDPRRERAAALYREVQILTHPRLRSHANIPSLLWYDFLNAGNNTFIPALVIERAKCGSLASLVYSNPSDLDEIQRLRLCHDVTAGLLALHKTDVVHGDVKTDNVLVFRTDDDKGYVAKLADFGSAIIVGDYVEGSGRQWRYYGTPTTNAPEVDNQSAVRLDANGLVKCDNYSLGLLMAEVILGSLDEMTTSKSREVLDHTTELLERSEILSTTGKTLMTLAIEKLLHYQPDERCGDLAVIDQTFGPAISESIGIENLTLNTPGQRRLRDSADIPAALQSLFGLSSYLDIDIDVELESNRDTQTLILNRLLTDSRSSDPSASGKALFQLCIAHAHGFGTPYSENSALRCVIESAQKGYLPAQATVFAFHTALSRQEELLAGEVKEEVIDWLFEATAWGSYLAARQLQSIDLEAFNDARRAFHRAGGFNQFFYPQDPPLYGFSSEFALELVEGQDGLEEIAVAAAIYGDEVLMRRLVEDLGMDPNHVTCWGESLLVLCCKAGHLPVLKILIQAGATTDSGPERESALHWLIAFDDGDVDEAAELLSSTHDPVDSIPDTSWNHPSIDLPGHFPLGTPLHFAAFFDASLHTRLLLERFRIPVAATGTSESSPLDFALPRRKLRVSTELVAYDAVESQPAERAFLRELGQQLTHETWAAAATAGLSFDELALQCIDLVMARDPTIVNAPTAAGFTPVMGAAQYHDTATLRGLILRGADVNAQSLPEYDGRTVLNLLTENKMQRAPNDDTLTQLLAAGADLSLRSNPGGKLPLHFAARDDDVALLTTLLDINTPGTEIDARTTGYGQTPLHVAAQYASLGAAAALLDRGADTTAAHSNGTFNAWDWNGLTPVAVAACSGSADVVEMLVTRREGSTWLARSASGHSVLHMAAAEGDGSEMMRMLLGVPGLSDRGSVDWQADGGVTALHLCACNFDRCAQLSALLGAAADPNVCTTAGHTALDAALALRRRLERMKGDFRRVLAEEGGEQVLRELLLSGADLWENISVPGRKFRLKIGEGSYQKIIDVNRETRLHSVDSEEQDETGGNEAQGDHGESTENNNNQGTRGQSMADEEDDVEVVDFNACLTDLEAAIEELRRAGGVESHPVGDYIGLFTFRVARNA